MLVITRKPGEWVRVRVGEVELWVGVSDVDRNKVRLAFEAPPDVEISREELLAGETPKDAAEPGG